MTREQKESRESPAGRSPWRALPLFILLALLLHLLFINLISQKRGKASGDGDPRKAVIASPGQAPARAATARDGPEDGDSSPLLVRGGYGNDPDIMRLRKEILPRETWESQARPDLEKEMPLLLDALKKKPGDAKILYLLSWNCLMREDYGRFFHFAHSLLKQEPHNPRTLEIISNAHYCRGEYVKCIEYADRAISLDPRNGFLYYLKGSSLLLENNDAPAAAPVLEEAVRLSPELPFAYGSLGQSYFEMGGEENLEKGMRVFQKGIEKFPDHQLTLVLMAEDYLYNTGDLDRTIELTNRIIELNPRNFQAYLMEGALLLNLGRYAEAERAFHLGVKARPEFKFRAEIQVMLGNAAYAQKKYGEAERYFQKAVQIQEEIPDRNLYRSDAFVGLAGIAMDRGDLPRAGDYLEKARKAYPNNIFYVISQADWHLRKKDTAGAEKFLAAATKTGSGNLFAREIVTGYLNAKIFLARGQKDEAQKSLLKSIESAPGHLKILLARKAAGDWLLSRLLEDRSFAGKVKKAQLPAGRSKARLNVENLRRFSF
jgi:tetratricopeptide (TPR) repeat protein